MVVRTLAHDVIGSKQNVKRPVHTIEIASALAHQQLPHPQCFCVATLQQHDTRTRAFFKTVIGIKFCARLFIKRIKVANRKFVCRFGFAKINQMFDEHAKRRTPVTNVILTNYFVTNKLEHAHNCVTDHC